MIKSRRYPGVFFFFFFFFSYRLIDRRGNAAAPASFERLKKRRALISPRVIGLNPDRRARVSISGSRRAYIGPRVPVARLPESASADIINSKSNVAYCNSARISLNAICARSCRGKIAPCVFPGRIHGRRGPRSCHGPPPSPRLAKSGFIFQLELLLPAN